MTKLCIKGIAALLGLLLVACAGTAAPQEVTVEVDDAGYAPDRVTVVVGQETKLTLRNIGTDEHDLGIDEIALVTRGEDNGMPGHNMEAMTGETGEPLQLHVLAAAGSSSSLEITPTKLGEYEFRCRIANHKEVGMLVVTRAKRSTD